MLFKRMILDEGTAWILPAVSFVLVAVVFAFAVMRALAGSKSKMKRLAALPIDEEKGDDHV